MGEKFHSLTAQQVVEFLKTDSDRGLSSAEAEARLVQSGPNDLPREKHLGPWLLFLGQFHSWLTYILFIAAGISFFVGHRSDAYGILFAVLIDAVFGFWQERKAERALEKLRQMVVLEATVIRDGVAQKVPSSQIVPGDIVMLEEGDRIPADARLLTAKDLQTDEAALTGESNAMKKNPEPVRAEVARPDMSCLVWLGTTVVSGTARAVIVATGLQTAFGNIASSLQSVKQERAPLEIRIDRLGQQLGIISISLALLVFLFGWFKGTPIMEMFFFAVALVVSVIPEGLPAVLAVVLAIGVRRMAKRNAIIRHVPSVETLGVADIICTDKTGTLTENKMTVRELYAAGHNIKVSGEGWKPEGKFTLDGQRIRPAEHPTLNLLLKVATICNKATLARQEGHEAIIGDPTEGALVVLGAKAGLDKHVLTGEYRLIDEIPFSSSRMYRAMLVESLDLAGRPERHIFVVGAYEILRDRSVNVAADTKMRELAAVEDGFRSANDRMGGETMRVLAVGYRRHDLDDQTLDDGDVSDLTLLGLVGMIDPPRLGVTEAIAQCRSAGVRIIMVTGDQRATATAIAREVGLSDLCSVEENTCPGVYIETDVAHMSDEQFDKALGNAVIFARISPATKLRIVDRLESLGHTVAMTGDGVNDAPALKRAAIGVAMGITGTDVSKEVSDMILADDNFISIVSAIEEGRIIFRNVKQTVAYLFMTNVGEVVTILASLAAGFPLPLLPAQILWMNLVTDGFPDIALATEQRRGSVLAEPPRNRRARILSRGVLILTLLTSVLMCLGTLALFNWELQTGDLARARTIAFTTMAMFQLWNVFNMRSIKESLFSIGFFSNKWVIWSVIASVFLQLAVLYVPFLQNIFRTVPINWFEWLLIVVVTSSVLWLVEGYKWLIRRGQIPASWLQ
ncbi:HAD-IC family P-type ATPase [Patescibacteria group bacterium]|nr:HAD-IC family P-type ATPase [Patescibacteria group bacterium]MBU1028982.1 HAD-IC family P-type ATPase [Patescibacteria group bacterium]MBU1916086.1 HAD-IC family P-type ATPase [Patescibacteria group bacterium]